MSEAEVPGLPVPPEGDSKRIWWIAAVALLVLVALRFAPKLENPLRPEPRAAHVAIQLDGAGDASDGMHEIDASRTFRLFAVLEAETFGGGTVYFTEAPALRLGEVEVPPESIRPWPAGRTARVRWLTVEGSTPYLAVEAAADLDRFRLIETYHAEWGTGWTATGVAESRLVQLERDSPMRPLRFGTQRFAARIEVYEDEEALTPSHRWVSATPDEILADPRRSTGVIATLPEPFRSLSAAFGRPRLELVGEIAEPTRGRAERLVSNRLAFFEAGLLAAHLRESGRDVAELEFETVELGSDGPRWGVEIEAGDLVGAGDRQLVLWRDEGVAGRLDPQDVAIDPHRGLREQRIGQVFLGEDGLRLDHVAVAPRARTASRR